MVASVRAQAMPGSILNVAHHIGVSAVAVSVSVELSSQEDVYKAKSGQGRSHLNDSPQLLST